MMKLVRSVREWFGALFQTCPDKPVELKGAGGFFIIGHRGSPCKEVENTIRSCEVALDDDGANALEVDLCITKDGVVILWHDWDPDSSEGLARVKGLEPDVKYCPCPPGDGPLRKPVNKLTFNEFVNHYRYICKEDEHAKVEAYIPSLDEFMRWAVTKKSLKLLFLDIKVPDDEPHEGARIMECVNRAIERYSPSFKIVFETRSPRVLEAMRRHSPHRSYSLDVEPAYGVVLEPASFSAVHAAIEHDNAYATPQRPRSLTIAPWSTYRRIVKHDLRLRSQHNSGGDGNRVEGVIAFTVNSESEMRCLIRMGVDGIQSDRPDLLRMVALNLHRIRAPRKHRVVMNRPSLAANYPLGKAGL